MGKSRHSIEGGGKLAKKNSRDKRAGLMDGMMGGSPTKDEVALATAPALAEATAALAEAAATLATDEVIVPPVPKPPAPESAPAPVASEDAPLDTETLNKDGSMDEMRALLAKGAVGEEISSPAEEAEVVAPASSGPTSLEDIYGDRKVPRNVAEMYAKLRNPNKRKDYLRRVAQQEVIKQRRRRALEENREVKNGEETKASPSAYSGKLAELENAYHTRYPDGKDIPPEVSEKYFALTKAGLGSMFSTDTASAAETEETEAEIEALIAKLSVPPMPMVPQPPAAEAQPSAPAAEAEEQTAPAQEPEVDASEFSAPQYAEREMQEEMDVLNESSPEPGPAVFRKNRERLIPTLTDVVELPGQQEVIETAEQAHESRPFSVETEIRDDGMEYVNILPGSAGGEGTPKEWREKLKALIENAKGKVEWWKSSGEHLIRRSEELNVAAEKIGWGEKKFRWLGEQYNKFGWKTKLAVGIGLGIGYGAALSAVSLPAILACIAGIGAQRAAGLATMYLKYEKARPYGDRNQKGFWNWSGSREKAMMKSMVYTAVMTGGMAYMAKEISDRDLVHRTKEWLGGMMDTFVGNHPEAGAVATAPSVLSHPVQPHGVGASADVMTPAGEEGAAAAAAPVAEMPSVEAKAGDGYERMLKNLWEQTKGTTYPEGSDMARLQGIDPKDLSAEIHRLATDNEFFKATGESVRINIGDKLSVDANGDLWLNDQTILAPEGAPTTPALNPEVAPAASDASMRVEPGPDFPNEVTRVDADDMTGDVEIPPTVEEVGVTEQSVPSAESVAQPSAGEVGPHGFLSANGTPINPDVTHGYASPKGVYVFGGNVSDVQAQEYALANRVSVFVDKSTKILGGLVTLSRVVEFAPSEGGTTTMIIHHDPSLVPDPKTFTKILF